MFAVLITWNVIYTLKTVMRTRTKFIGAQYNLKSVNDDCDW